MIYSLYYPNLYVDLLLQIISDRLFLHEIEKAIKLQASAMSSPVYYYYFSYRGAHSKSELRTHTDENFGMDCFTRLIIHLSCHNFYNKQVHPMVTIQFMSYQHLLILSLLLLIEKCPKCYWMCGSHLQRTGNIFVVIN